MLTSSSPMSRSSCRTRSGSRTYALSSASIIPSLSHHSLRGAVEVVTESPEALIQGSCRCRDKPVDGRFVSLRAVTEHGDIHRPIDDDQSPDWKCPVLVHFDGDIRFRCQLAHAGDRHHDPATECISRLFDLCRSLTGKHRCRIQQQDTEPPFGSICSVKEG